MGTTRCKISINGVMEKTEYLCKLSVGILEVEVSPFVHISLTSTE